MVIFVDDEVVVDGVQILLGFSLFALLSVFHKGDCDDAQDEECHVGNGLDVFFGF